MAVFGCDFGSSMFHVCKDGKKDTHRKYEPDDFIELSFAGEGDIVIVELAHLQPQKETAESSISLSQGLTYSKLCKLSDNALSKGVTLRVAPHSLTPRLRNEFYPGEDKSDDIDAASICHFWDFYKDISGLQLLKPAPPGTFPKKLELSFEIKEETDAILNFYRGHVGDYAALRRLPVLSQYLDNAQRIQDGRWGMFASDPQAATDAECWIYGRTGKSKVMKPHAENSVLASLWVCVYDRNGNLRLNPETQNPLGVNFIWKTLLGNKPNHFRGGVARSNIMYHGFKTRVLPKNLRKDKDAKISINPKNLKRIELNRLRRAYAKVCKDTLRSIQGLNL